MQPHGYEAGCAWDGPHFLLYLSPSSDLNSAASLSFLVFFFSVLRPLSVQTGKYAAWDNIDLPMIPTAPEDDDHTDHFEGEQDDYTMLMHDTSGECDHEVHPQPPS